MNTFLTNKEQIIKWLDKYEVKNYKLLPDEQYGYIINVTGDVNLSWQSLDSIPVKFNKINGSFYCGFNKLTSLEFCPQIVEKDFSCHNNKLINLEFCPQEVGRDFDCGNNLLTNLEFCPHTVKEHFLCAYNRLTSLEFCPQEVGKKFFCANNSALGELQTIEDFTIIYQEHRKFHIEKLANKLEKELEIPTKSIKIKI